VQLSQALPGTSRPSEPTKPYKFIGFGAIDITKPYKLIRFGARDVTKPYKFIGFGAMDVTKPYKFISLAAQRPKVDDCEVRCGGDPGSDKAHLISGTIPAEASPSKPYGFIGFGAADVTKPYKFIGFGDIDGPKPYKSIGPTKTSWLPRGHGASHLPSTSWGQLAPGVPGAVNKA
jgi:hypothetical protein